MQELKAAMSHEVDMEENEKSKNSKSRLLSIVIVCFALLAFSLIMFIYMLVNYCIDINANYVEESATITKYEKIDRKGYYDYTLYYEYEAPDGTIYSGIWRERVRNIEYANEMIGEKITIYVAHDLHRQKINLDFKTDTIVIYAVLAVTSLVVFIIFLQKYLSFLKRKNKKTNKNNIN